MKFLLIVLAIRFVIEVLTRKEKNKEVQVNAGKNINVRHPAERELR